MNLSSLAQSERLIALNGGIKSRLDKLNEQVATGKVSQTYGGLGTQTKTSIDLRGDVSRRDAFISNIEAASSKLPVMVNTLEGIGDAISELVVQSTRLIGTDSDVPAVAAAARRALAQIAPLLNTTHEGRYLFSGTDDGNPPVPDAENILSSGFHAAIRAQVLTLGTGNAATVLIGTVSIGSSDAPGVTPFSTFLSTPAPAGGLDEARLTAMADEGLRVPYGLRANANGGAVSPPGSSGSFVRDALRTLSAMASLDQLSSAQIASPDFAELAKGLRVDLESAGKVLNDEAGMLGATGKQLEKVRTQHLDVQVLISTRIGKIEDVDMAETIGRLQAAQTQLQISYKLTSQIKELNLAQFL
jgi:flagellin-like hook-associated protein FlgL